MPLLYTKYPLAKMICRVMQADSKNSNFVVHF